VKIHTRKMSGARDNWHGTVTANLRKLLARGKTLLVPGAGGRAQRAADRGARLRVRLYRQLCDGGGPLRLTDTGLLSLESLVEQARTIARAVRIPVIADAEGGFEVEKTFSPSRTPGSPRSTSRITPARASTQALLKSLRKP
jgi:2-methylisocitrate lyase-like PEP mutase family enzyme